MEKMVNERLQYQIEAEELIKNYQSGFSTSTSDPAIYLENEIRKAQVNKESLVAIFFDAEKAYDTMWNKGTLIKLHQMGIRGRMLIG